MIYEIKPYIGVGDFKLGMTKEEIILIKGKPSRIKKHNTLGYDVLYKYDCVEVEFDKNGVCISIEIYENLDVRYNDDKLLGVNFVEINSKYSELDNTTFDFTGSYIYPKYGFGLYVPNHKDKSAITETVIVFKEGYYD